VAKRSLQDLVVAITGAGRGIGLATATLLHENGAKVAIGDVDAELAASAAAGLGDGAIGAAMDVTDESSFGAFLAKAEQELGQVDVLINNAGIMPLGPFHDEPMSGLRRVFEVNVMGCATGMKLALPKMLERGSGQIVNVASVAGKAPVPAGASYAASKAAIISLSESARIEYRGRGVDFTCVMPSFTATELISGTKGVKFVKNVTPEQVAKAIVKAIAKPRFEVYVPGNLGALRRMQAISGRRMREAMDRSLGVDKAFVDIDTDARAAYEERIATKSGSASAKAGSKK